MGFRTPTYALRWPEGSPLHGLEIAMRPASVGVITELTRFQAIDPSDSGMSSEDMDMITGVCSKMAALIVSWNFEDENGEPIPVTPETVQDMDFGILMACIGAYLDRVVSVGAPLGVPSGGGTQSPAPSIPMETL